MSERKCPVCGHGTERHHIPCVQRVTAEREEAVAEVERMCELDAVVRLWRDGKMAAFAIDAAIARLDNSRAARTRRTSGRAASEAPMCRGCAAIMPDEGPCANCGRAASEGES